jgi:hypothetical protein
MNKKFFGVSLEARDAFCTGTLKPLSRPRHKPPLAKASPDIRTVRTQPDKKDRVPVMVAKESTLPKAKAENGLGELKAQSEAKAGVSTDEKSPGKPAGG